MNPKNLLQIAKKDLTEVRSNPQLLAPLLIVPIIFSIVLPLIFSLAIPSDPGNLGSLNIDQIRQDLGLGRNVPIGGLLLLWIVNSELKPFMLLVPTMFTMIIASDSIAGEKERKTIESFLVLPLTDREIIIGKVLGAFIPGLVAAWLSFAIMGVTVNVAAGPALGGYLAIFGDLAWWVLMILAVPLVAFMSTLFMVLISSIARNTRAAQQYSIIIILPVIALVIGGFSGAFTMSVVGILVFSGIIGIVTLFLAFITTKRLNRERLVLAQE